MSLHLILDVESAGLHGEGFAVGAVVVSDSGTVHATFYAGAEFEGVPCRGEDRAWMLANCIPTLPAPTHASTRAVRDAFWSFWMEWKKQGADMWADCGWPVEARFLAACVDDAPSRCRDGPYPLNEIATVLGTATHPRLPSELPAHNPLNDARQSARLLVDHWQRRTK